MQVGAAVHPSAVRMPWGMGHAHRMARIRMRPSAIAPHGAWPSRIGSGLAHAATRRARASLRHRLASVLLSTHSGFCLSTGATGLLLLAVGCYVLARAPPLVRRPQASHKTKATPHDSHDQCARSMCMILYPGTANLGSSDWPTETRPRSQRARELRTPPPTGSTSESDLRPRISRGEGTAQELRTSMDPPPDPLLHGRAGSKA